MKTRNRLTAVALAAACANGAFAMDVAGFEFHGYSRGGPVFNHSDGVKGNLALGGELQKFRLGNEGDNGIEIDLIKRFETSGIKWKVHYMPVKWGSGDVGTDQAYVEMTGFDFAPEAKFWAGQRRLRIQDVHIVDNFLMNYGDNQGAGVTDIPLGGAKLGLGVFTGDKFDNNQPANVKARRINADISEINVNPGGTLRVLLTAVNGTGQVNGGSGSGISISHNQKDFLMPGMSNALFLQGSRGHARIDGQFESIDGKSAGKRVFRIADSIGWQMGRFVQRFALDPLGHQGRRRNGRAATVGLETCVFDHAGHAGGTGASLGRRHHLSASQERAAVPEPGDGCVLTQDSGPSRARRDARRVGGHGVQESTEATAWRRGAYPSLGPRCAVLLGPVSVIA